MVDLKCTSTIHQPKFSEWDNGIIYRGPAGHVFKWTNNWLRLGDHQRYLSLDRLSEIVEDAKNEIADFPEVIPIHERIVRADGGIVRQQWYYVDSLVWLYNTVRIHSSLRY